MKWMINLVLFGVRGFGMIMSWREKNFSSAFLSNKINRANYLFVFQIILHTNAFRKINLFNVQICGFISFFLFVFKTKFTIINSFGEKILRHQKKCPVQSVLSLSLAELFQRRMMVVTLEIFNVACLYVCFDMQIFH